MITVIATKPHYEDHLAPIVRHLADVSPEVAIVASYHDLAIARKKHDRIVLAQHGIGQSYSGTNPAYPGGYDNGDVGLFLVPNEHAAGRWRAAYPHAAVEVVGSPRLDDLPARGPGPFTVAVSFHWNKLSPPEMRSAWPYYRNELVTLAERFNVIGHGHPMRRDLQAAYGRLGIEYVPDFDDVCRRADVYVCDNSSTIYEFASTGRPVVVLNSPEYRRDVDHGLRFWEASSVGVNVNEPEQLAVAVEFASSYPNILRTFALDKVYAYRTGAGVRAAEAVRAWARVPVAA